MMTPLGEETEATGEISSDNSHASSCIDDILNFDPDAVDFEPLLVSDTGKILSYHSESYLHEYEESISGDSSVATPVTQNGNHPRDADVLRSVQNLSKKRDLCSSSRFVQLLSLIFLAALMVVGGLAWFAVDSNNYSQQRLQTSVAKNIAMGESLHEDTQYQSVANNIILQQHIMNVDIAAHEASASKVAFWEPYMHYSRSINGVLIGHLMSIMSQCFVRSVFELIKEETGAYDLRQIESMRPPQIQGNNSSLMSTATDQQTSPAMNTLMVIFTPDFRQAAIQLFDHFHQGAFITILHDPMDIYLEQYTKQKDSTIFQVSEYSDNILVRYLSGLEDEKRRVNSGDYDVARQVLRSKFVIGTCDHPTETLRRFAKMIGTPDGVVKDSGQCTRARQNWNQGCRNIKGGGFKDQKKRQNLKILNDIRSEHHYDFLLYQDSKILFKQQNGLFQ